MGNLQSQTNEPKPSTKPAKPGKVKQLMKIRGKRGPSDKIDTKKFTGVVPQKEPHAEHAPDNSTEIVEDKNAILKKACGDREDNSVMVTDSWCKVNRLEEKPQSTPPSAVSSSSDSNFTDPAALTPIGFNAEINQCYYSEESVDLDVEVPNSTTQETFLHNLTLNSFKLNDYRARHEEEKSKKLSKLGVSKTSQISLDSDPKDSFVSDNVQEFVHDENWENERDDGTLKRRVLDGDEESQKVSQMVKRMSDVNLANGHPEYKRHMSVPVELVKPSSEGQVMKKVASLTLSKQDLESKITKPRFVPEKLDFQLYEKFEGYMLVNWYVSEFSEDHHLVQLLNGQNLKLLAIQFCTHLLAAGVLRQIQDKDVPIYNIFKPDLMYYWTHAETPLSVPQTPGRLSMVSWPPMSPSDGLLSSTGEIINVSTPRTPSDLLPPQYDDHRHNQEFKNSARDVEILSLEEENNRLRQEVEKYKTVIEIQNLTAKAVKDFSSPVDEQILFKTSCDSTLLEKSVQTDNNTFSDKSSDNYSSSSTQTVAQSNNQSTQKNDGTGEDNSQITQEVAEIKEEAPPPPPPPLSLNEVPPPPPLPPPLGLTAPPPPPMPGMTGPPPPPMPGMTGPPPPPMPGMVGPPPPPMPGMAGPPPPPMPGMIGPPPPPMPGMTGPPPPPMPGATGPPPPPPIPGLTDSSDGPSPQVPDGPVPLPAPPVGGWSAQKEGLRKTTVNPTVPMRPLYWTRILAPVAVDYPDPEVTSPIWTQIDELPLDNLNEFTDLFSRQVVTRKPTVKKLEQKTKIEAVKLLDGKRSQNVGILAQSLHLDFQEIENAIYNFDTSIVSLEALQQIYEVRATTDELNLIKSHLKTKPDAPLDKPEQFLQDLSEISNFAERIFCLMFQVEFEDSINTISHTLTNIKSTCEYMVNSAELKEVFAIILTLGNYMNGGNMTRGQADGFGLEILSKLKDVKSKDSKTTLLHYVVKLYMKKIENPFEPNVGLPVPEPGDIKRAASVNFDDVKADLQKLEKQLLECENRTEKVIETSTPDNLQPFKDKMSTFLEHSKKQLATECENLEDCKIQFVSTMKFYLFKPKTGTLENYPPNSFFEMWLSFCVDFKDIFKKELIRLETEKVQEMKKKESERLQENVKIKERENGLKSKIKKLQAKHATKIETK